MPRLTAIVPATDRPATLDRCVDALRAAREPPDELLVIEEPAGAGPAAARNAGARRAGGEVLVFVDSDVVVHADAMQRLRAAFDADPGLTAVFGAYDDAPEAPGAASGFRNLLHHHVHSEAAGPATTFWAGLGAVRADAFAAAGGFDERRYPHASIEDVELGLRLTAAGARIELDPRVSGTHLKAWTLRSMVDTDLRRRGVPWVALLLRTRTRSSALNLGPRHQASAAASLAVVLALAARRPRAALGAAGLLVALNARLYALLLRRRGAREAAAGVALHALHHIVSAIAIPAGLFAHARDRSLGPHTRAPSLSDCRDPWI